MFTNYICVLNLVLHLNCWIIRYNKNTFLVNMTVKYNNIIIAIKIQYRNNVKVSLYFL